MKITDQLEKIIGTKIQQRKDLDLEIAILSEELNVLKSLR